MNKKIKALIVDDSLLFREVLSKFIREDESIEVVGTACDSFDARDKILKLRPDVITLDVEMPKMSGIDFLKKLMPQYPLPVVVVSSTPENAFAALEAGAVDFIKKPVIKSPNDLKDFSLVLNEIIKAASQSKVKTGFQFSSSKPAVQPPSVTVKTPVATNNSIIAIGASTGGVEALVNILPRLPANLPPILVTQHMPEKFTEMFAKRLNRLCNFEVQEAVDGTRLTSGLCLIAAGGYHLSLMKDSRGYYVSSKPGEKVSGHCPSVDVLFNSVAKIAPENTIGVILTGMGKDGANGLLSMKNAGAYTIGQDKDSCVVYGMPMVAKQLGAVAVQKPLDDIPNTILNHLSK